MKTPVSSLATVCLVMVMGWGCQGQEEEYDLELCRNRESHWRSNQHDYLFSGILEHSVLKVLRDNKPEQLNWSKAREFCRRRCMDLVSLESEWEARLIARKMKKFGANSIWTSGHICDHSVTERCYTDEDIQPRIVRGWFWGGSTKRIPPTNSTPPGWSRNPWGTSGAITQSKQKTNPDAAKVPQPDNAEQVLNLEKGEEEACLVVGRDKWEKGTFWDDVSCYHEMEWVCEDSTELLTKAGLNQPIIFGKK